MRNKNDLKTKQIVIDNNGYAEFNEKIDMKTFIDVDSKGFVDKMAKLEACLNDGTIIGSVDFNLSSFAKPDTYK